MSMLGIRNNRLLARITGLFAVAFMLVATTGLSAEIHDAVKAQDIPKLTALLKVDRNHQAVNAKAIGGSSPLHWAAACQNSEAAAILITAGADINATTKNGSTALHWAANKDALEVARLLLENGADVNAHSDQGYTPMHWAAIGDSTEMVRLLYSYHADVNAAGSDGVTPLHCAVQKGFTGVVKMLIDYGANPALKTQGGATAESLTRSMEMRALLQAAATQPSKTVIDKIPTPRSIPLAQANWTLERVVVANMEPIGVSASECLTLTENLRVALVDTEYFDVVSRSDMDRVLDEQQFQRSGACSDSECLVEVGQLLSAQKIIGGTVGMAFGVYNLTLRFVDVQSGKILFTVYRDVRDPETLLDEIRRLGREFAFKYAENR